MAALASAADLDLHLQRSIAPDVAALALAGASGAVRSYCGWGLLRETTTFTVDGTGSTVLDLPTLYLVSISDVLVDGLAINPDDVQPVVHPRGQLVWANIWPNLTKVEVEAVHGYDPVPDIAKLLTLTIAARIINNPDNLRSASVGTVTRSYDAKLTALDMRLLDQFRL